jgi:hypothetical protein
MKPPFVAFLNTPLGRKLRLAALIFALLFTASAVAQYLFIRTRIQKTSQAEFQAWTEELRHEVNYTTNWNLKKFRQADWTAPGCYVFSTNGLVLDIEGFVAGLVYHVTLPEGLAYGAPTNITSGVGETWRILAKKLRGGVAILGTPQPTAPPNADALLQENATQFGTSIEEAARIRARDIDRNVDYAVVDDSGVLRSAIGGIPLRTTPPRGQSASNPTFHLLSGGKDYAVYCPPVLDAAGNIVGLMAIPRDATLERQTLRSAVRFNTLLALVSWLAVGALTVAYFVRSEGARRAHLLTLAEALQQQESDTLEFKSSVRWDYNLRRVNRDLEEVIVKTVVAFLNTSGGLLVIGVGDDKSIQGLQPDYDSLSKKSRDGLQLHLQQIISQKIGVDRYQSNTSVEFHEVQGQDVCLVRVKPAPRPVILKDQNAPALYVRAGGASRTLNVEEAIRYIHDHWGTYV